MALLNLGRALTALGRYEDAERRFARAVELWEPSLGAAHAYVGRGLEDWSRAALLRGDLQRSIALSERAVTVWTKARGADNLALAEPMTFLGLAHLRQGALRPAAEALEAALGVRERHLRADDPDFAGSLLALAELRVAQRRMLEARGLIDRALKLVSVPEQDWVLARQLWEFQTDRARALSLARRAMQAFSRAGHPLAVETSRWLQERLPP